MDRETVIQVVLWTMKYYGSEAGERKNPGSKLQSQAEHIADVIDHYNEACDRLRGLEHVTVSIMGHKP